jgi:hypothetical protein
MYNFKKDIQVYVEYDGYIIPIDVYPDITFSQTFNESSHNKKTLHQPLNLNKGSTIVEANTANFSFTTPIKYDSTTPIDPLFFAVDYASGNIEPINIYIETTNKKFKLDTCVIERYTLNLERVGVFTMTISGTASKLEEIVALPNPPEPKNEDTETIIRCITVKIDNVAIDAIAAINIEIANNIEWTKNTTLHGSLNNEVAFRKSYVLTERQITGSVTEFLLDSGTLPEYSTTSSMIIELSSEIGQSPPFLTFNLPEVVYTRRLNVDEIFTRVYDFRLTDNTVSVIPSVQGV